MGKLNIIKSQIKKCDENASCFDKSSHNQYSARGSVEEFDKLMRLEVISIETNDEKEYVLSFRQIDFWSTTELTVFWSGLKMRLRGDLIDAFRR